MSAGRAGVELLGRLRADARDLKSTLARRVPLLRSTKRWFQQHIRGENHVGNVDQLSSFAPFSSGAASARASLTLTAAQQTFPLLVRLLERTDPATQRPVELTDFCEQTAERAEDSELKGLFDRHGSDKATDHNYHLLYQHIMPRRREVRRLLEIGLGTNNPDVVSSMGRKGRPGASLRAFRDYLPLASIYGADIDDRVLFTEDRIETCHVDQTDLQSFAEVAAMVGGAELDIIIDDGLHAPNANLAVLLFAMNHLAVGGWLVIEDISPSAEPIWTVVRSLMPATYDATLLRAKGGLMFVAQRKT
jgi:hypothetical protein